MSAIKQSPHRAKIIYAVYIDTDDSFSIGTLQGLEGAPVYPIKDGELVAIVSDTMVIKARPDRKSIVSYQAVLHDLTERKTILPMRFGTISKSRSSVEALLKKNHKAIVSQVEKLEGCAEMGLRVSWDVANIYDYFISIHAALRDARDELLSSKVADRDQKIELGRLYETFLTADRRSHTDRVKEILEEYCEDIVESELKREKDVMNLACLVKRSKMDDFVNGVFEASKLFDNSYLFDYSGPWAPHNFVHLDLKASSSKSDD